MQPSRKLLDAMTPIRAFLFVQDVGGQWVCKVFRDLEPLVDAAIAANGAKQHPVGVHIGFDRPETRVVSALLSEHAPLVYLSTGAVGALPHTFLTATNAIGEAGQQTFRAALSGFGYEEEEVDIQGGASRSNAAEAAPIHDLSFRGWLVPVEKYDPELAKVLRSVEIWDEDSYLDHEVKLDQSTRVDLALRRYDLLVGKKPTPASILDNLRATPPWLLRSPVATLSISLRSRNVCASHKIYLIGDIERLGLKGMRCLPNLGDKSVEEICREVLHHFTSGYPLRFEETATERTGQAGQENTHQGALSLQIGEGVKASGTPRASTIIDGFKEAAKSLTENERGIWAARLGFKCEPMTFQQIAGQIGLTRERIRQIETKIYRKVSRHPFWDELSQRVSCLFRGRTSPLFLDGISVIDPWFDGVEGLAHPLQEVCKHIPRVKFNVIYWNESPVVSHLTQSEWNEALDRAKQMIPSLVQYQLDERDAMNQAASVILDKGEEMREALIEELQPLCIWTTRPDGTRILIGTGKSAASWVLSVLEASDTALHLEEIQRQVTAQATYEATNIRNLRRAASETALLYGRSFFGLRKHCPLNEAQLEAIRVEVDDIVSGGQATKQWHSNELYEELLRRGFSYDGKLTKYIINIAISDSTDLVYLGRMIWGLRSSWRASTDSRLDVKQAIVSLLEAEGKPMSTAEIRQKLSEGRGLNRHFQIWDTSPLIRLGPGIWGLEERDLDVEQIRVTSEILQQELERRQEGLHTSEVARILNLESESNVSALLSVASKSWLKIDKDQYCYLKDWGESRRMSVSEAAKKLLNANPHGLPRESLRQRVSSLIKRQIDWQTLRSVLHNMDAIYDHELAHWKRDDLEDKGGDDVLQRTDDP